MQWPLVTCNPWRCLPRISVFVVCQLSAKQKGLDLLIMLWRECCGALARQQLCLPKLLGNSVLSPWPLGKTQIAPSPWCGRWALCSCLSDIFCSFFNDLICMFTYIVCTAINTGFAKQYFGRSVQCQMETRNAWQNSLGQKQQMWGGRNCSKPHKKTGQGPLGRQRQSELTRGAWEGCSCLAEGNPPVSFMQIIISFNNSWLFCWVLSSHSAPSLSLQLLLLFSCSSHLLPINIFISVFPQHRISPYFLFPSLVLPTAAVSPTFFLHGSSPFLSIPHHVFCPANVW